MALDRFFTGFESGENAVFANVANVVFVDDGNARTGQYYLRANVPTAAANDGRGYLPNPTAGQAITNGYATAKARIFFRLVALPSGNYPVIFGFGVPGALQGTLRVKSNGKFAAAAITAVGADSAATLSVNTWYKAELAQVITDPAEDITVTVSVYTEVGVLIETVTKTSAGVMGATPNTAPALVGHGDAINSTFITDFDDWIAFIEDNGPATLPTAERITRVDATGIATNTNGIVHGTNWSGDYREITDIPFETVITDEMSSMDLDTQLTFNHRSATDLGVTGCQAMRFYLQLKATIAGNEWFVINGNAVSILVGIAYTALPLLMDQWLTISDTDFTNLTFGVKNQRTLLVNLGQMYAEALHSGSNYWPAELVGTDGYKVNVVTYIGDGNFRDIIGVGFKPQLVIIKKDGGVASGGAFKLGLNGGTASKLNTAITKDPRAIRLMTADGFSLGPSTHVNEVGINYTALCIQDGGSGHDCRSFRIGAYVGNAIDSTDIAIALGFNPDVVFISGGDSIYRNNINPGDYSLRLSASAAVTNLIQALGAGTFQIGDDANLNTVSLVYYFFTFSVDAALAFYSFTDYDAKVAAGATTSFTAFLLQPLFAIAKREAAVAAQWRAGQSGNNSNLWSNSSSNTTGIIAILANGLTLGATLSNPGDNINVLVFHSGAINPATGPTVDVGPDQTVAFGTRVTLPGTVVDNSYQCAVITSLWTIISSPPGSVITNWNVNDETTLADFSKAGVYVLRLTGSNGIASAFDELTVTITCPDFTVDPGPDQIVLFNPGIAILSGTAT